MLQGLGIIGMLPYRSNQQGIMERRDSPHRQGRKLAQVAIVATCLAPSQPSPLVIRLNVATQGQRTHRTLLVAWVALLWPQASPV